MTVRPAQMMHPVSQMIQPMLKEALPGPTVKTNNREQDVPRRAYVISKCNIPPFSEAEQHREDVFLQKVG